MHPIIGKNEKIRHKFNFRHMDHNRHYSEGLNIGELVWKLSLNAEKHNDKWMFNVFLVCEYPHDKRNWIVEVNADFTFVKQKGNGANLSKEAVKALHFEDREVRLEFCSYAHVDNYDNGFEIDKFLIVEVQFDYKYYNFSELWPGYTDRLIRVNESEFKVNKMQLASSSKYFYQLFITDNYSDSTIVLDDSKTTDIDFLQFLAAIQPNSITITRYNYKSMINCAEVFGCSGLHQKCENYLIYSSLDIFEKLKFADKCDYNILKRHCVKSISTVDKTKDLTLNEKFEQLSTDTQFRILKRGMNIV